MNRNERIKRKKKQKNKLMKKMHDSAFRQGENKYIKSHLHCIFSTNCSVQCDYKIATLFRLPLFLPHLTSWVQSQMHQHCLHPKPPRFKRLSSKPIIKFEFTAVKRTHHKMTFCIQNISKCTQKNVSFHAIASVCIFHMKSEAIR